MMLNVRAYQAISRFEGSYPAILISCTQHGERWTRLIWRGDGWRTTSSLN